MEKKLYLYKFKVKHDHGTIRISATGYSIKEARELICKSEKCPDRALSYIRKKLIKT